MFFNYVCELKTTSNMAGTMVFGDLLQNCVNQRLFETYNAPEYERIQMLHKLSGLYSEAYENTALFFGEEPVEVRFFGVPGGDEDDFMLNAVTRLEDGAASCFPQTMISCRVMSANSASWRCCKGADGMRYLLHRLLEPM